MKPDELPVIDWPLALKLAGNNKSLALDLLNAMVKTLPEEIVVIKNLYEQNDITELRAKLHRIQGALSYCGLPRLKNLITRIESEIKNNIMVGLPSLLIQLDVEVSRIIQQRASLTSQT